MEKYGILRLKCDGTRAETRVRLSAKRTSPFTSAGVSVQSTTGSRGVRISGSNTPCYEVVWRVLDTHSIRQFPPHFPSCASSCAITFQLDSRAGQATYDNIILCMRFVCWITTSADTHLEYVILIFHGTNGYAIAPQRYVYTYTACVVNVSFVRNANGLERRISCTPSKEWIDLCIQWDWLLRFTRVIQ
jgi:hypothetical protein